VGVELFELVDAFSELGKLVRSTWREVEDVRQQDDWAVLKGVGQPHRLFATDRQFELWGGIARCKCHNG
jgi:hypothetical protein